MVIKSYQFLFVYRTKSRPDVIRYCWIEEANVHQAGLILHRLIEDIDQLHGASRHDKELPVEKLDDPYFPRMPLEKIEHRVSDSEIIGSEYIQSRK